MKTFKVADGDDGARLDRWIKLHHPQITQGKLQQGLRKGWIKLEGKKAKSDARLNAGMTVSIAPVLLALENTAAPKKAQKLTDGQIRETRAMVIYEDAHCLVLNKPAGLAVQGGSGITDSVDARLDALMGKSGERPRLVHRLDKDTSGALLLAKTARDATLLTKAFAGKEVKKIYLALAMGVPDPRTGKIDLPLSKQGGEGAEKMGADEEDGKRAITLYHVADHAHDRLSLIELAPVTGRTHQLRAHMAAIGHPILGDGKYGGKEAFIPSMELGRRLHLHAWRIMLPSLGLDVTAPLPEHIRASFKELGFDMPGESYLLETME